MNEYTSLGSGMGPAAEPAAFTVSGPLGAASVTPGDLVFVELLGVGLALLAAVMLAITAVCVRQGTRGNGVARDAVLVILSVNLLLLAPVAAVLYQDGFRLTWTAVLSFAAAGLSATLFGRLLYYSGIERIGASRAEPIVASTPFHATIIAVVFLGEALTGPHFVGIVLIVGGIAVISWAGLSDGASTPGETSLIGFALPLVAAFCFGLEPVFARRGFEEGTPALVGVLVKAASAMGGFLAYFFLRGDLSQVLEANPRNLRWYAAAGVTNSVMLVAYYLALTIAPVVLVLPLMYTTPLFVAALSYLFLQDIERVTPGLVAASLVVVAGAVLVTVFN